MTGIDIYKRCVALMGYTSADSEIISDHALTHRFIEIVNQAAADLKIKPIKNLLEEFCVSASKADALCYAAAMFLALSEGDEAKNQLFASLYNTKRATALAETDSISDVLPKVSGKGI